MLAFNTLLPLLAVTALLHVAHTWPRHRNIGSGNFWFRETSKQRCARLTTYGSYAYYICVHFDQEYLDGRLDICPWLKALMSGGNEGESGAAKALYPFKCADFPEQHQFVPPATTTTPTTTTTTTITTTTPPPTRKTPPPPVPSGGRCGQSDSLRQMSEALHGSTGRIVGGVTVKDCTVIPWQVRLKIQGRYLCGGSVLTDRHVLTAAHCLDDIYKNPDSVKVFLADHDKDDWEHINMQVERIDYHPDFDDYTYENDIAVLTLTSPMDLSHSCIQPICLDPAFPFDGHNCVVSGWGKLSVNGFTATRLQMVQVLTHEGSECYREFSITDYNYITDEASMICAGDKEGGKDSCQGDSGGPLVCYNNATQAWVQVGIVSNGKGCAMKGFPGVYSSIRYFYPWIQKYIMTD